MKLRTVIIVQIALLLAVIVFGGILYGDLASEVRNLHRIAASLSIVAAIASVVMALKSSHSTKLKSLAAVSLVSVLLAGFFGSQTPGADNYSLMLNLMRASGGVAFISSVCMLIVLNKKSGNK